MNDWHDKDTDTLCEALLRLKTREECYAFLEDVCTVKEILEIARRLAVAGMLREKQSYAKISGETGVSTATISRINRCLEYGSGGYATVLERLKEENND